MIGIGSILVRLTSSAGKNGSHAKNELPLSTAELPAVEPKQSELPQVKGYNPLRAPSVVLYESHTTPYFIGRLDGFREHLAYQGWEREKGNFLDKDIAASFRRLATGTWVERERYYMTSCGRTVAEAYITISHAYVGNGHYLDMVNVEFRATDKYKLDDLVNASRDRIKGVMSHDPRLVYSPVMVEDTGSVKQA